MSRPPPQQGKPDERGAWRAGGSGFSRERPRRPPGERSPSTKVEGREGVSPEEENLLATREKTLKQGGAWHTQGLRGGRCGWTGVAWGSGGRGRRGTFRDSGRAGFYRAETPSGSRSGAGEPQGQEGQKRGLFRGTVGIGPAMAATGVSGGQTQGQPEGDSVAGQLGVGLRGCGALCASG